MAETRQTDPTTGGEKNAKPERFALVPARAMREVARVYEFGARKYADHNWRKGYPWSWSIDALERHINAFKGGEDLADDSQLHHLAHAVFHCLALMEWSFSHPELDDRYLEVTPNGTSEEDSPVSFAASGVVYCDCSVPGCAADHTQG